MKSVTFLWALRPVPIVLEGSKVKLDNGRIGSHELIQTPLINAVWGWGMPMPRES